MSKICGKCKIKLPLESFHNMRSSEDGKQAWCKECIKANTAQHTNTKPERNQKAKGFESVPNKVIYGIVDGNKNLVYVGESKVAQNRLWKHFNSNSVNTCLAEHRQDDWSYIILWDGTDFSKQDRLMLEAVLIQSLRPKYNKQWNQDD